MRFIKLFSLTANLCFLLQTALFCSDILILFTSDVHGNIVSDEGGFLRISSAVKEAKKEFKENQVILLDCGDSITGTFDAAATRGEIIVKIMNLMGYEFWIPGNHEFDYGYEVYLKRIAEFQGRTLVSNLWSKEKKQDSFPYYVVNKGTLKIAIIGATFPDMNPSENIFPSAPFKSRSISRGLETIMPEIVSMEPDLIILAVHGGMFNKTWNMAGELKKFPQIKLVLGGHTHQPVEGKVLYNGAYFVQPGHSGEFLGKVDVTFSGAKEKPQINSRLIEARDYQPDEQLFSQLKDELADLIKLELSIAADIPVSKALESGTLVSEAMREITRCDAAIFGLQGKPELIKGTITRGRIFRIVSHEDTISKMSVNRDELKEILQDMHNHIKKKKKYKSIACCGIKYKVSRKGIVSDVEFPVGFEGKERIDIAISSYYIEYPTIKFPSIRAIALKKESNYTKTPFYVRDVFEKFLSQKYPPQ